MTARVAVGLAVAALVAACAAGGGGAGGASPESAAAGDGEGAAAGTSRGGAAGPTPGTGASRSPSLAEAAGERGRPAGAAIPPVRGALSEVDPSLGLADGVAALVPALDEALLERALRFSPLPPPPPDPTNAVADDPRAARLGQRLFFDPSLSATGEVSCATCHDPALGFGDGRTLSRGLDEVKRHAPTLWNVAYQRWFFWDGRRDTLWGQALVPLEHPKEMGGDRVAVVHRIAGDAELAAAYEELFGPLPDTTGLPAHGRPVPDDEDHPHGYLLPDGPHDDARPHAADGTHADGSSLPVAARIPAFGRPPTDGSGAAVAGDATGSTRPAAASRPRSVMAADETVPEHGHADHPHQAGWDQLDERRRREVDTVFANVGKALAAYQRRLVSRRAPFDVFVEGLRTGDAARLAALDAPARRGLRLFLESHCHLCHSGPTFSDLEFHDARFPLLDGAPDDDLGRWGGVPDLVGNPFRGDGGFSDAPDLPESGKAAYLLDAAGMPDHDSRYQFKTPTLRNVALSPPYGHQGSLADLDAVVLHYSTLADAPPLKGHVERFFVPAGLVAEERADLRAFLESLTDTDVDPSWLAPLD